MTVAALWTKHRPLARALASGYRIPGMDRDDMEQEALIALWQAARSYDPARGAFKAWARRCVNARLTDLLRAATGPTRHATLVPLTDTEQPEHGREELRAIVAALPSLTAVEREAITASLDGSYRSTDRRLENALYSARRKLREAA